jgi:protein TonB
MYALRAPFAVVVGAFVSVGLFLGLSQLVSVPFEMAQPIEGLIIEFTPQIKDTPIENKRDPKVTRKTPTLPPGPPRVARVGSEIGVLVGDYDRPPVGPIGPGKRISLSGTDGDAIPLVRPNPDYPPGAITRELEGWVQVQFSVTAVGTVRDATVVASEPGTTFDEAALKAIARWRYNPRVADGVAVERVGLQTVIRFELDQ